VAGLSTLSHDFPGSRLVIQWRDLPGFKNLAGLSTLSHELRGKPWFVSGKTSPVSRSAREGGSLPFFLRALRGANSRSLQSFDKCHHAATLQPANARLALSLVSIQNHIESEVNI
jgi:hypothetical protein